MHAVCTSFDFKIVKFGWKFCCTETYAQIFDPDRQESSYVLHNAANETEVYFLYQNKSNGSSFVAQPVHFEDCFITHINMLYSLLIWADALYRYDFE